jgi:hypothetical protein
MTTTTIRHKSTGNLFNAEFYNSFVYLVDELRTITIDDFNDFFEIVVQA